jgi:hypothetical protein
VHDPKLTSCCAYADPEHCLRLVSAVTLHHGPDFVLFVLKIYLEHVATHLLSGSPMRDRFLGLASRLDALLAPPDPTQLDPKAN